MLHRKTTNKETTVLPKKSFGDAVVLLYRERRGTERMILEELWYGNINPLEDSTDGKTEVKKLLNLVGRNRDKLCESMTEQQKADLAKYDDSANEMYGIIEQEVFKYAFRLGARIMLETMTGK